MSPTVRNVNILRKRKQNDYVKENIYQYMSFTQVGNDLNEDALLFLQHKVMQRSEETIYYETVVSHSFTQYSMKSGMKELG